MRLVCISDTHGYYPAKLPAGDILIHAGDFTAYGSYEETERFFEWLDAQPFKDVLAVPGNHDVSLELTRIPDPGRIHLLMHQSVEIEGFKIFGSPITPVFNDWAFMATDGVRDILFQQIPEDTDILVTHGPPRGVLDRNFQGLPCGCPILAGLPWKPQAHIFGHIHEQGGRIDHDGQTYYVNASLMNEMYRPLNEPIVLDL